MNPRILLLAGLVLLSLAPRAAASTIENSPKILLHARFASSKGNCTPGITSCADATLSGLMSPEGNFPYYVYILAAQFDTAAGVREIHVALNYDTTTLTGVDIFSWHLCASGETPGPGWYQDLGDNIIAWDTKGGDSLRVAGYFYATAYSAGYLALVPAPGGASLTPFSGDPVTVGTGALGFVGFGTFSGCNPCLTPCSYTAVQPSTWSFIKSFFHSH